MLLLGPSACTSAHLLSIAVMMRMYAVSYTVARSRLLTWCPAAELRGVGSAALWSWCMQRYLLWEVLEGSTCAMVGGGVGEGWTPIRT